MNKDKAIQLLERLQDPEPYEPMLTKDAYDALQMAIDALSADDDTISRKAAIDALDEIESEIADGYGYQYAKWREYFAEIPSAQPEHIRGHWICDRSWSEGVGMGESYGHYWKCDKCGHLEKSNGGVCGCNFCSNCGSDNREEKEK